MIEQTFHEVFDEVLAKDAIINYRHTGFVQDYLLLHVLLRRYKIKSCFEIGTHVGWGTTIIKNAMGDDSTLYSLDLPDDESYKSNQHPFNEGRPKGVGHECNLPYTQLYGDSTTFDYSKYPCEGVYIDAEHSYENVLAETMAIIKTNPQLVIYHDADSENVYNGIVDGFYGHTDYRLYRVVDTRIAYAIRKESVVESMINKIP